MNEGTPGNENPEHTADEKLLIEALFDMNTVKQIHVLRWETKGTSKYLKIRAVFDNDQCNQFIKIVNK